MSVPADRALVEQVLTTLSSEGAAAALRGAKMGWNLCYVVLGESGMRFETFKTLPEMVKAIERAVAAHGNDFAVRRCFYGAEITLEIEMVVQVGLRLGSPR